MNEKATLNKFQCRRKNQIEVYDERNVVKGLVVLDPIKDYSLFEACKTCGYGSNSTVLKSRDAPFEYYEIKRCTLRKAIGL